MDTKLHDLYQKLKADGLTSEQERKIQAELDFDGTHGLPDDQSTGADFQPESNDIFAYNDFQILQDYPTVWATYDSCLRSIDELLENDKKRELPARVECSRARWRSQDLSGFDAERRRE